MADKVYAWLIEWINPLTNRPYKDILFEQPTDFTVYTNVYKLTESEAQALLRNYIILRQFDDSRT